jgi:carbonic anhydrase
MPMKYHTYKELLENNSQWAQQKVIAEPGYFDQLAKHQKPRFLFIGCADSRMPLDTFTQTEPGELFIHRNIANQVSLTDMNFISVLEYAVDVLKVEHVIVSGHYCCGGIEAAYRRQGTGMVENWLAPIVDLAITHQDELEAIENEEERLKRLTELNVVAQVANIFKTSIMHRALAEKRSPRLHGWVMDIHSGLIKELALPFERWKKNGFVPHSYIPYNSADDTPKG